MLRFRKPPPAPPPPPPPLLFDGPPPPPAETTEELPPFTWLLLLLLWMVARALVGPSVDISSPLRCRGVSFVRPLCLATARERFLIAQRATDLRLSNLLFFFLSHKATIQTENTHLARSHTDFSIAGQSLTILGGVCSFATQSLWLRDDYVDRQFNRENPTLSARIP